MHSNFNDTYVQKYEISVEPGIWVKLEMSYLKKYEKIMNKQIIKFKTDVANFLSL